MNARRGWTPKPKTRPEKTQGQSLVEVALTLPLVVVLFVGLVEVAFLAFTYLGMLEASREGARLGGRGAALFDDGEIEDLVGQDLERQGIDADGAAVEVYVVRAEVIGTSASVSSIHPGIAGDRPVFRNAATIQARLDEDDPHSRIVIVEIYYDYRPFLNFPLVSDIFPDPLPLHTYSIMRLLR